ncbi:prolyl 4-hydroxylase alpha subunit [Nitzschia inconspicua]|uniref:Prolyl 4-hydroxylase alpha subunit n=1 Tax=Nitzschia inconspicua TaxID=303405 RepID=A0A9K3KVU7_9STRA|nr:prolyl 4-hydroxylase alpha subunit [Nitzschia inconspicua]
MTRILLFIVSLTALSRVVSAAQENVNIKIRNESGHRVILNWVHPQTKETVVMREMEPDPQRQFIINSFVHHKFQLWQAPDEETGSCGGDEDDGTDGDQTCKTSFFQVTQPEEQAFVITKDFHVETDIPPPAPNPVDNIDLSNLEDPTVVLEKCKNQAAKRLETGNNYEAVMKEYHICTTTRLTPAIKYINDEVRFERDIRIDASVNAENFTCTDPNIETSPDVRTEEWTSSVDQITRTAHIKLDRPTSRIHVIENFASIDECNAMEEEAQDSLSVASTADGKGGTTISLGRKAMQAAIRPKFSTDGEPLEGDLISQLSGRVYEYTNHVLGLGITPFGQEPLMSIQYFGRGYNDTEPDRYTPHCDGKCVGQKHIDGARMATMVIYCTIPEKGGFTNFQNANVHVKPSQGSAIFFSYIDPSTNMTDDGLTQHSGCPVYDGEKKIITQWVRYGVSSDVPHSAFNTLNVLKSNDGE